MLERLVNEEIRKKVIVKFRWSEFENHILTKNTFCNQWLVSLHRAALIMLVSKD